MTGLWKICTDCGMEKTHVDMKFTDGKTEPEFLNILKWQLGWNYECKIPNKSLDILDIKCKCRLF